MVLLVGGNGGSVGALVNDASFEPAEKDIKRPKNPQWQRCKEEQSPVKRGTSPSAKVIITKSCCCSTDLCGVKAVRGSTPAHGVFYVSRGNYIITRERTGLAEFRSQGRPELMHHYAIHCLC